MIIALKNQFDGLILSWASILIRILEMTLWWQLVAIREKKLLAKNTTLKSEQRGKCTVVKVKVTTTAHQSSSEHKR